MATDQLVPNPGSVEAHKQGCTCGVEVSNDGNGNFVGVDGTTTHPTKHLTAYFYDEYKLTPVAKETE